MKLKDIDFRVWDISKKVFYNDLEFSMLPNSSCSKTFRMDLAITFAKNLESACMLSSNYEVDFYTGFMDRNGKKIYEGDILTFEVDSHDMGIIGITGEVAFKNGRFIIKGYEHFFPHYSFFDFVLKDEGIEIIGNIHESKDL